MIRRLAVALQNLARVTVNARSLGGNLRVLIEQISERGTHPLPAAHPVRRQLNHENRRGEAGRFRVGRLCSAIAAVGRLDLDLRAVQPSQDEVTLTVRCIAGTVRVIVPPDWRVEDQVLVLGTRRAVDRSADRGTGPLLRLRGIGVAGTFVLSDEPQP